LLQQKHQVCTDWKKRQFLFKIKKNPQFLFSSIQMGFRTRLAHAILAECMNLQ